MHHPDLYGEARLGGSDNPQDRDEARRAFQSSDLRVDYEPYVMKRNAERREERGDVFGRRAWEKSTKGTKRLGVEQYGVQKIKRNADERKRRKVPHMCTATC